MNLETVLTVGVAGGGLYLGGTIAKNAWMWMYEQYRRIQRDNLDLERRRLDLRLNSVRLLKPDANGRQGIVFDGQLYHNLDTHAVFTQMRLEWIDPMLERILALERVVRAASGLNGPALRQVMEAQALDGPSAVWPRMVQLADLFGSRRPSIHDLVIGVRPKDEGGLDVVSLGLHELMHTLTVGASGWGKSTWLRSLLWQIAHAQESIEIVAVDIAGSEFNVLRNWGKLRWPVARTPQDAKAVLAAVSDEIKRRKRLFEENAPVASKLTEYNRATGADLPPWLVAVDEGTHLLNQPGIGEPLRAAVQTARQYGVYILVAGQSAKHSVIDTQVRDNFSSRLCFKTSPTSSRVVLDDKAANELTAKGRMIVQLVGREQMELQGPFVTREEFMQVLQGDGPRRSVPASISPGAEAVQQAADEALVLDAYEEVGSISGAARAVWGVGSGDNFYRARRILIEHGRITP